MSAVAINEAKAITASLKRVRQNIEMGVTQADSAISILSQDGEIIDETLTEHKYNLKAALGQSKMRLNKLKTAEIREKQYLFGSLLIFSLSVGFIILRRTRVIYLLLLSLSLVSKVTEPVQELDSCASVAHCVEADCHSCGKLSNMNARFVKEIRTDSIEEADSANRAYDDKEL